MIELSDDPARLDFGRIHGWLASSYWSPGISRALVERAARGSHCLGAYRDGEQVGYARAISDRATFAWLADVWVADGCRGEGLGRRMVAWYLDHPDYAGLRRWALVTRDAHGVYKALGFDAPARPENYMERVSAEFAAILKGAP
ncbi:MAG: GNAT family N-acetyltransferase [Alphaproteobacteria bacterium]|nr:GNAT family N-acetyltransferase [Alphaproteobacteria bacterium]